MVNRLRRLLHKLLDAIDPPDRAGAPPAVAPCPGCNRNVLVHHTASGVRDDLAMYRCICGEASAWYWSERGPLLVYCTEPGVDPEIYESMD